MLYCAVMVWHTDYVTVVFTFWRYDKEVNLNDYYCVCYCIGMCYTEHSGRTSVSGWLTFPVLHSTYSWWVTTIVDKLSATRQLTRPTRSYPFVVDKWVLSWNRLCATVYGWRYVHTWLGRLRPLENFNNNNDLVFLIIDIEYLIVFTSCFNKITLLKLGICIHYMCL